MGKGAEQKEHRYFCRTKAGWLTLCLLLLCVLLLSLRFGSSGMDWQSFFGGLLRQEGFEAQSVILYSLRLPRLLQGVLAGIGLSVSGVLLQSVTGNDLASPNIIGVNAGAGFAVILILSYFPAAVMGLPLAAFLGAFLTTLAIMGIANRVDSSKATVILAGIAVQAVLSAGISFFSLLDTDVLVSYNYFSVGGLSNSSTDLLWLPGTIIFLGLAVSLAFSGKIQLLCLGDSMALSLGVKVKQVRMLCLVCASASAAAVVSFAGLLGFVGLMVPHISRKLAGTQTAPLLAVSAAVGSILVLTADLVGRTAFAPSEVPVGIVMSLDRRSLFLHSSDAKEVCAAMLSFHQVCASYGKNQVLDHIDFSLVPHKLTAVVGRNGSGKSTLVSCVNQELPYTGEITFSDRNLAVMTLRERAQLISILPQTLHSPAVTVEELTAFGRNPYLDFGKRMSPKDWQAVDDALEAIGISGPAG